MEGKFQREDYIYSLWTGLYSNGHALLRRHMPTAPSRWWRTKVIQQYSACTITVRHSPGRFFKV